jgi:hypothetical protein
VKTSVFIASLCLSGFASTALAASVSIKGNVSETLTGSDNYFLSNSPSGPTGQTLSTATLDTLAQTPTTQYLLNTYYSYYKYFGPGAADQALTSGTPAHARFSVDHTTELAKFNFAASWTRADVATTQLQQSGFSSSSRGSFNTYTANGGVAVDLNRNDSITWTAQASTVSYTDPTQTPYVDVTSAITWSHSLSATTTLTNSVSADWFSEDNAANSQRLFWTALTGVQSQLTRRLTVTAHVGVDFANAWQNGNAAQQSSTPTVPLILVPFGTLASLPFQPQVGAANGWLADVSLTYDLLKTTRLSFNAGHTTVPLFTGQLQTSDSIALGVNHTLNSREKIGRAHV